jgi:hypothetical protein
MRCRQSHGFSRTSAHSGWAIERLDRRESSFFDEGEVWVKTTESLQQGNALSQAGLNACRRSLLRGLSIWPIVPVGLSAWWVKPPLAVVLRNGWVLSKDD